MSLEPIGLITILLGILCLGLGYWTVATTLVVTSLFGSAAALIIGSANIQPGHLFLFFAALATLGRRREALSSIRSLHPNEPAFWLACLVIYGVASAYFLPRVMTGSMQIIPLGSTALDDTGSTIPLVPVSSNLTQSVYLIANLLCFCMTVAICSTLGGFKAVLGGIIAYTALNILVAALDLGTYATGTQELLSFMRNAQYVLHTDDEVSGMKRIVGSFTEASSFARSTLGVLGFTGTLWLLAYRPMMTGTIALISTFLLVLSTSSTGLVGVPALALLLFGTALFRCGSRAAARYSNTAVLYGPLIVLFVGLIVALDQKIFEQVFDYLSLVVLDKSTSDSGIERSSWNTLGIQNFVDSWGIGVGLGTARTSSFVVALLATVGIPGAIFYAIFFGDVLFRQRGEAGTFPSNVRLAARNALIGLTIGDLLVGPVIDQGIFFYVLAGLAVSEPERSDSAAFYPETEGALA